MPSPDTTALFPSGQQQQSATAAGGGSTDAPAPSSRWPIPLTPDADALGGRARRRSKVELVLRQDWPAALFLLWMDIALWIAIYSGAGYLRHDAYYAAPIQYFAVEAIPLIIVIQALYIIGGYQRQTEMRSLVYTTEHILAMMGSLAVSLAVIYSVTTFDQSMRPSRAVLLLSFVVFTPVSMSYRRLLRRLTSTLVATRAFLVIGSGDLACEFYRAYRKAGTRQRLEFVALESDRVGQNLCGAGTPVVEGDIGTKLERLGDNYSGVVLAERVDRLDPDLLQRLVRTQFHNTRVYTLESFYEQQWKYVPLESIDPFWPLQRGFQLARTSLYHYVKRLFDVVAAATLLLLFSPLIALITLLIWWRNGRPALFRQDRVGREGAEFCIFKFRTMHHQPRDQEEDLYTREGDPRVTGIGRWLRKLRIDELPQLWNVLRGDMSLIGPRAEWTRCAERYEKVIPFYHFRHLVKPGITGWAQVNYPYGESKEDAIEKLKYDLYYIRHYSLKLDAMIVLKTVQTVLFGRGR